MNDDQYRRLAAELVGRNADPDALAFDMFDERRTVDVGRLYVECGVFRCIKCKGWYENEMESIDAADVCDDCVGIE